MSENGKERNPLVDSPETKQDLKELVKLLKPALLKVYKLSGFPTDQIDALTPKRLVEGMKHVDKKIQLDADNEMVQTAASLAWQSLYDDGKVGSTSFYRPPEIKDKLPF